MGISYDWRIQSRVTLAPINMLNAQGTRSEEESVPRQGRCGPSGHGWLKRLSDLTVSPSQARTHSNIVPQHPTRPDPYLPQKFKSTFLQTKKNLSFQTGF